MSLEPRHLYKKQAGWYMPVIPLPRRWRQGVPGACCLARLVKSVSASLSVSTTKMESKKGSPAPMHTHKNTIDTHHTHIHTYK